MTWVLAGQLLGAVGMLGVIWTIQLVHYPLMALVPAASYDAYQAAHTRRITWVVGPLMAIEGVTTLILLARPPEGVPAALPWVGAATLAVALGTTAFVSAPIHGRLARGHEPLLLDRLVRTNWIRTAAWTAHATVAIALAVSR